MKNPALFPLCVWLAAALVGCADPVDPAAATGPEADTVLGGDGYAPDDLTPTGLDGPLGVAVTGRDTDTGTPGAETPTADTGAPDPHSAAPVGDPPSLVSPPVISGAAEVGARLTATAGTWDGADPMAVDLTWQRCAQDGSACVDLGAGASHTVTGEDILHTLKVRADASNDQGAASASSSAVDTRFAAGTVCAPAGGVGPAPERLETVVVIVLENRDADILGTPDAPYLTSVRDQCGSSSQYVDNTFSGDINSLSHYLALTSGSNCDSGLGHSGSGCVTDDESPHAHRLSTTSIFEQVGSWKAYQEDMPSNCGWDNPSGNYFVKHNPPAYYTNLADCGTNDVPIARISCPGGPNQTCTAPQNALVDDLRNDTMPEYAFVTPDIENDMHDGSVPTGDNWLHTYLPIFLDSPAYRRGGMAIYVLWDEQEDFTGGPIPNVVISPFVEPTISTATMNHFAALRTMEDQLGIATHLGCASGTAPGGGSCPAGSTTDLRAEFGF